MLTRNQKSKMVYDVKELKEYFDKRFNELKNSLDVNNTLENFKSEIKSDLQKLEDKIDNKIKALESDKKLLQQQVTALAQQNKETQQRYDELEQYGPRLCLRIDRVSKQNNEKVEDVFKCVKGLFEEVPDLEIPEIVIDRAHRIGPDYTDKKTQKVYKSIIVCFTTFRHRTAFYRARRSIGNRSQVRLDLTKR